MALWRVSFFWKQDWALSSGYSENFYNTAADIPTLIPIVNAFRTTMKTVKGNGIRCPYVRIADLQGFRGIKPLRYPEAATPVIDSAFNADFVNTAGLLKLHGTDTAKTYIVNQWLRSMPDGAIKLNGDFNPSQFTIDAIAALKGLLVSASNKWVLYAQDKTIPKIDITAVTNAGVVTALAHGLANGNRTRISRTGGMIGLNRIWKVARIDADNFQLVGVSAGLPLVGNYTKPGTSQKQEKKAIAIDDASVDRSTSHRTGRPFGLSVGRRKIRAK